MAQSSPWWGAGMISGSYRKLKLCKMGLWMQQFTLHPKRKASPVDDHRVRYLRSNLFHRFFDNIFNFCRQRVVARKFSLYIASNICWLWRRLPRGQSRAFAFDDPGATGYRQNNLAEDCPLCERRCGTYFAVTWCSRLSRRRELTPRKTAMVVNYSFY